MAPFPPSINYLISLRLKLAGAKWLAVAEVTVQKQAAKTLVFIIVVANKRLLNISRQSREGSFQLLNFVRNHLFTPFMCYTGRGEWGF